MLPTRDLELHWVDPDSRGASRAERVERVERVERHYIINKKKFREVQRRKDPIGPKVTGSRSSQTCWRRTLRTLQTLNTQGNRKELRLLSASPFSTRQQPAFASSSTLASSPFARIVDSLFFSFHSSIAQPSSFVPLIACVGQECLAAVSSPSSTSQHLASRHHRHSVDIVTL